VVRVATGLSEPIYATAAPNDPNRLFIVQQQSGGSAAIKILDLACGSGAFLVAAFDYLIGEYERVNRAIAELTGAPQQRGLFDLNRQILQENLFGVDLNNESVRSPS
jgi:type II restriction/modification system DNA methylase subunit YeeA